MQAVESWPEVTHHACSTTFANPRHGKMRPSPASAPPPASTANGKGVSRNAWIGIAVVVLIVLALSGFGQQEDGRPSSGNVSGDDHPLSAASCRAEARDVIARYPGLYSSVEEYVEICSGASRDLFDDLVENPPGE